MNKWKFQEEAINNIVNEFKSNNKSRSLVIIPTGGGKTLTAIRAIDNLIKKGLIDNSNKCLWVTHLRSLKDQTIAVRDNENNEDFINEFNFSDNLKNFLQIEMVTAAKELIRNDNNKSFKYVVLDECHHSSANSYQSFFDKKHLGILGLTATPKRMDKKKLAFEKDVYQITADKLEDLGVIIRPRELQIDLKFEIKAPDLESNQFDFPARNREIVKRILRFRRRSLDNGQNDHSKVIIYVNTQEHAKNLYKKFAEEQPEEIQKMYDFGIHFITGSSNSLGISNKEFLDKFKKSSSGIIINVNILSEGFDDPGINSIALAVPTGSLVSLIQRVGRAIRCPNLSKNDLSKINPPYVLEFTDNLPNIGHKMTFGWLFADISDDLEPELIGIDIKAIPSIFSRFYSTIIKHKMNKFLIKHQDELKPIYFDNVIIDTKNDLNSTNLFLFWSAKEMNFSGNRWNGVFVNKDQKEEFVTLYNNLNNAVIKKINPHIFFEHMHPEFKQLNYLNNTQKQQNFYNSLKFSFEELRNNKNPERLKYFTFKLVGEYDSLFKKLKNLFKYFINIYINR